MNLKSQDILFLLKLIALGKKSWSFNKLAVELGMSPAEIHAASKRTIIAKLAIKDQDEIRPHLRNLEEFLLHGIQYVFVPERSGLTRGMPTCYAAAPLDGYFESTKDFPPVWPHPEGKVRGESFSPLYKAVPIAAGNDPVLYELLVLVDAIRGGRNRERNIAQKELKQRLEFYGQHTES